MGAEAVSREELYELVWSVPMVRVAEKFNVSGSYMARVCSTLHVPRPERAARLGRPCEFLASNCRASQFLLPNHSCMRKGSAGTQ
jgi:hypothetical protein